MPIEIERGQKALTVGQQIEQHYSASDFSKLFPYSGKDISKLLLCVLAGLIVGIIIKRK